MQVGLGTSEVSQLGAGFGPGANQLRAAHQGEASFQQRQGLPRLACQQQRLASAGRGTAGHDAWGPGGVDEVRGRPAVVAQVEERLAESEVPVGDERGRRRKAPQRRQGLGRLASRQ